MSDDPATYIPEDEDSGFKPSPMRDDAEMDITPMIDIVFLMLIYFLVCSHQAAQLPVKLPPAMYGTAVSDAMSLTLLVQYKDGTEPTVSLLKGSKQTTFPTDPEQMAAAITQAVQEAKDSEGKTDVLLKIDRELKQKNLEAIRQAISEVEDVRIYMAVDDTQKN